MGRKKIIITSIFVFFLILMMPSIPAVQQRTLGDKASTDVIEKIKDIECTNNKNFGDIELLNDDVKLPMLYLIIYMIYKHRVTRLDRIFTLAVEYGFMGFKVLFPVLFVYALWLGLTSQIWFTFWNFFSDEFKLNWDLKP